MIAGFRSSPLFPSVIFSSQLLPDANAVCYRHVFFVSLNMTPSSSLNPPPSSSSQSVPPFPFSSVSVPYPNIGHYRFLSLPASLVALIDFRSTIQHNQYENVPLAGNIYSFKCTLLRHPTLKIAG